MHQSPSSIPLPSSPVGPTAAVLCTVIPDDAELKLTANGGWTLKLRLSVLLGPTVAGDQDPALGCVGLSGVHRDAQLPLDFWPQVVMSHMTMQGAGVRLHLMADWPTKSKWHSRVSKDHLSIDRTSYAAEARLAQSVWSRAFNGGRDGEFSALHRALLKDSKRRTEDKQAITRMHKGSDEPQLHSFGHSGGSISQRDCVSADTQWMTDYIDQLHVGEVARRTSRALYVDKNAGVGSALKRIGGDQARDRSQLWATLKVLGESSTLGDDKRIRKANLDCIKEFREDRRGVLETRKEKYSPDAQQMADLSRLLARPVVPLAQDQGVARWAREKERFRFSTQFERPLPMDRSPESTSSAQEDAARQRMSGFQGHPTLAKLVRLLVDVELEFSDREPGPFAELMRRGPDWTGEVCAEYVCPAQASASATTVEKLQRTKFRLRIERASWGQARCAFLPASQHEVLLLKQSQAQPRAATALAPRTLLPVNQGFLELRHHAGRFRLRPYDSALAVSSLDNASSNREHSRDSGASDDDLSARLPTMRTHGIQLVDTGAGIAAAVDLYKIQESYAATGDAPLLYAEDLLLGYRVDVERSGVSGPATWNTATGRSFHYQDISRPGGGALYPEHRYRENGVVHAAMKLTSADDTHKPSVRQELFTWTGDPVGLPSGQEPKKRGANQQGVAPKAGLAQQPVKLADVDAAHDLNIGMDYEYGVDKESTIPALRYGDKYRFVMRACFLNGGGPRFGAGGFDALYEACALGASGTVAGTAKAHQKLQQQEKDLRQQSKQQSWLPLTAEAPYLFTTTDPVGAPRLALLEDDPLVRSRRIEDDCPQERLDRVVLRWDGRPQSKVCRRVLLPPQVGFEEAERQRQFDTSHEAIPQGALRALWMDGDTGLFPQAFDGGFALPTVNADGEVSRQGSHRGPVAVASRSSEPRQEPFYCDARSRRVVLALTRGTAWAEDLSPPFQDLLFWDVKQTPQEALPIVLEFRQARQHMTGARFIGKPILRSTSKKRGFRAYHLPIEVGLAEEISVHAWCVDDEMHLQNYFMHSLVESASHHQLNSQASPELARLKHELGKLVGTEGLPEASQGLPKTSGSLLTDAFGQLPLDVLQDVLRFTVVSAVRRPMQAPAVVDRTDGGLSIGVVKLRSVDAAKRWAGHISSSMKPPHPSLEHLHAVDSETGGDVAFLHGTVQLHRRSTDALRVEMLWKDFDDDLSLVRRAGGWKHEPRGHIHEFKPEIAVELDQERPDESLSLAMDPRGQPRHIAFDVGKQARRVAVRLIAVSRFRHCFLHSESASAASSHVDASCGVASGHDDPAWYESENAPREAMLCDSGPPSDLGLWIPATERPPAPEVSEVELVSHQVETFRSERGIVVEKSWCLRVRLARGSWYKSGEGELLAVVLRPDNLVSDEKRAQPAIGHALSADEFERSDEMRRINLRQQLSPETRSGRAASAPASMPSSAPAVQAELSQQLTAWAVDPSLDSGQLESVMSPAVFDGWVEKRSRLPLPFKTERRDGSVDVTELDVSVLGYVPMLDAATGDRVVDIDMRPPDVDSPFVRLSLARYQPHALRIEDPKSERRPLDLSLSPQVVLDPVALPSMRRAEIDLSTPERVKIRITGPAYRRRAPTAPSVSPSGEDLQAELLRHRHVTDVPWMRIALHRRLNSGAHLQAADALMSALVQVVPAVINGQAGTWSCDFLLPHKGSGWVIHIQEIEFHAPSQLAGWPREGFPWVEVPRAFNCEIPI